MLRKILDREPIIVLTAVGNLIALLVAFGVDISSGQKAAVMAVVGSALALAGRQVVTPVAAPRSPAEHG